MRNEEMSKVVDATISILEDWIKEAQTSVDKIFEDNYYSEEVREFGRNYKGLLESARRDLRVKEKEFEEFVKAVENEEITPAEALKRYYEVLSFENKNKRSFLPCFSDEFLKIVVKGVNSKEKNLPSPFRGIYFGWRLGEIYRKIEDLLNYIEKYSTQFDDPQVRSELREKIDDLKTELKDLFEKLKIVSRMSYGETYDDYKRAMKRFGDLDRTNVSDKNLFDDFEKHIKDLKKVIRDVVFKFKKMWIIRAFPYPPITPIHYYLAGLRFYYLPIVSEEKFNFQDNEFFYVQSRDSGLFLPREHYGMILRTEEVGEIEKLINVLPPGSLFIDLSTDEVTEEDRKAIFYFEEWSRMISEISYSIVEETLESLEDLSMSKLSQNTLIIEEEGLSEFKKIKEILGKLKGKNPLRKFYFDTGIFGALKLAEANKLPKISYLTLKPNREDRVKICRNSKFLELSSMILRHYIDHGCEFFVVERSNIGGIRGNIFNGLTLVPYGENLQKKTTALFSFRDDETRKIAHGIESYALYVFIKDFDKIYPFIISVLGGLMGEIMQHSISFFISFLGLISSLSTNSQNVPFLFSQAVEELEKIRQDESTVKIGFRELDDLELLKERLCD